MDFFKKEIKLSVSEELNTALIEVLSYVVLSNDTIECKKSILNKMLNVFPDFDMKPQFEMLLEFMIDSGNVPGSEYVNKHLGITLTLYFTSFGYNEMSDYVLKTAISLNKQFIGQKLRYFTENYESYTLNDSYKELEGLMNSCVMLKTTDKKEDTFLDNYIKAEKGSIGMLTGIDVIDKEVIGIEKGNMFTLAGYTGSFKTMMALNILYHNVVNLGYNMVYVTLEVPKHQLISYLLSRHSTSEKFVGKGKHLEHKAIRKALLSKEDRDFLFDEVYEDLFKSKVRDDGGPRGEFLILDETDLEDMTADGIAKKLYTLPFKVDGLIVDYIQLLQYGKKAELHIQGLNPIDGVVQSFRQLSVRGINQEALAVFLVSQTSRDGYNKATENEGRYELKALAETRELERSSYYVLFLYCDDLLRQSGELKVTLAKHRGGEILNDPIIIHVDPRYVIIGDAGTPEQSFNSMGSDGFNMLLGNDNGIL